MIRAGIERAHSGISAGRLTGNHARRLVNDTGLEQFAKSFPYAIDAVAAPNRDEDAVRRTPQAPRDLECNRFETFNAVRIRESGARAQDCRWEDAARRNRFSGESFLLPSTDNLSAVRFHQRDLKSRRILVTQDERIDASSRSVRGGGGTMIASADRDHSRKAELLRHRY